MADKKRNRQITLTMKKTLRPDSKTGKMVKKQGYRSVENIETSKQNTKTGKIGVGDTVGTKKVGSPVARRTGRKAGVMTSGEKPETQITSKKDYSKTIKRSTKQLGKKAAKGILKKAGYIGALAGIAADRDVENFKNIEELERGKMSAGERKITDETVNKVKRAKGGKVYKCSHNRLY